MSLRERDLPSIAKRHGVNILECVPDNAEERLRLLRETLKNTNVPSPINPAVGARYLADATANKPFGVGKLSNETVDLGEYNNYQNYDGYSAEEHLSWACLVADQQKSKTRYACREYLVGERAFEIGGSTIPDYYQLNARIYQQTGWQLATVNKIIPAELFFTCHSKRFFPVTTFMRELELDYLEEPDIGHDIAGHVATFTIPAVAHVMQNHGIARDLIYAERDEKLNGAQNESHAASIRDWADELLLYAGRIYWFTVEFGLVMQDGAVRDFGAGILSSPGETVYSIDSVQPNRILINPSNESDLLRLATIGTHGRRARASARTTTRSRAASPEAFHCAPAIGHRKAGQATERATIGVLRHRQRRRLQGFAVLDRRRLVDQGRRRDDIDGLE